MAPNELLLSSFCIIREPSAIFKHKILPDALCHCFAKIEILVCHMGTISPFCGSLFPYSMDDCSCAPVSPFDGHILHQ